MNGLLSRWMHAIRNATGRGVPESALDEELNAYVELIAAEKVRGGMNRAAALRAARVEAGSMEAVKENVREARSGYYLTGLLQDARHSMRALRRTPGYALAIILTLALGVGATTAIFTVVREVVLRQLPYADPNSLVRMWPTNPGQNVQHGPMSVPELEDWRNEKSVFSHVAGYSAAFGGPTMLGKGEPVRLKAAFVTADFFNTLGVHAYAGRTISEEEHADGANHVVVLSYDFWRTHYGADRRLIGNTITLNNEPYTVVGVMPASMSFPASDIEAWLPASYFGPDDIPRERDTRWLMMIGRLQPGVTRAEAARRLSEMQKRLESVYAASNAGWSAAAVSSLRDDLIGPARGKLAVIFSTVMLIMVLGCVNIANLVLARATQRSREIAVRAAIGATRARLIRQLLTESLLLSLIGGAIGVMLAWWGSAALAGMSAAWLPLPPDIKPDWMVLTFALLLTVLTGVAFGLIPATTSFTGLSGTLRDSGRGNSASRKTNAMRRMFVSVELALAVVLVAGAALFVQSFTRLSHVDMGFDVEHTAFARLGLPEVPDATHDVDRVAQMEKLVQAARAMPGVEAAGLTKQPPLRGEGEPWHVGIPGRTYPAGTQPVAQTMYASPGFFDVMGMKLRSGRDFTAQDDKGTGSVVLSESLAHTLFADQDPVGRTVTVEESRFVVIGVVSDIRMMGVDKDITPMLWVTRMIMPRGVATLFVRGRNDPGQLLASLRSAIRTTFPEQPINELSTTRAVVNKAIAAPRFLTFLLTLFGVLALLLAAIGVYGVVSYVVGQRTNEIGIRMALGAGASGIVGLMMRTGMAPVAAGLVAGIAGAAMLGRLVHAQLYQVSTANPLTYLLVAVVLAAISMAATGVPALRATRIDPTLALRE